MALTPCNWTQTCVIFSESPFCLDSFDKGSHRKGLKGMRLRVDLNSVLFRKVNVDSEKRLQVCLTDRRSGVISRLTDTTHFA